MAALRRGDRETDGQVRFADARRTSPQLRIPRGMADLDRQQRRRVSDPRISEGVIRLLYDRAGDMCAVAINVKE